MTPTPTSQLASRAQIFERLSKLYAREEAKLDECRAAIGGAPIRSYRLSAVLMAEARACVAAGEGKR